MPVSSIIESLDLAIHRINELVEYLLEVKMKFNFLCIVTFLLFPMVVDADTSQQDEQVKQLLGCYTEDAEEGVLLKLSANQGKYSATLYDSGRKVETIDLQVADQNELMSNYYLSPQEAGRIKANLIAQDVAFGVLLVNPGDEVAGQIAETNYLGLLVMGVASLNKIPCD